MKDCERIINNDVTPEDLLDNEDEVHSTTPTKVPPKQKAAKKASVTKQKLFQAKEKAKEMFANMSGIFSKP